MKTIHLQFTTVFSGLPIHSAVTKVSNSIPIMQSLSADCWQGCGWMMVSKYFMVLSCHSCARSKPFVRFVSAY
jgi:hypothetical protein